MPNTVLTSKQIYLPQLINELEIATSVPGATMAMTWNQGQSITNQSDVVTIAQLQSAVDAHIAVFPPSPTPRDWNAEYANVLSRIPAGPFDEIKEALDLLAERTEIK